MKKPIQAFTLCGSFLLAISLPTLADVSLSVDSSVTLGSSSSWTGGPVLSMLNPNQNTSVDGNVTDGIIFRPSTGFTLGSFEFYGANGGPGANSIGTYNLSLYDLGSSFTLPATSPLYTFTGSEVDLFSSGLNFTTTANTQFDVLNFSGADQVSLTAGDSYLMVFTTVSGGNLVIARGGPTANQVLGLATTAPSSGVALNNVPAGANRTPVAAFYAAPVPEPSSLALVGAGAVLLAIRRFRK
ncbi:MAG TPA: PEP-CTERM sorting domain-containing protein [Verrucomicrobiae bacterium]|nr:PEP-CTERM sorting domain-containing protein [Verrucomicrobiae bacterium]